MTSTTAAVTVVADPAITANPVSPSAVCVGGTLPALTVTASGGTPTLLYQWYSNTTNSTTGGTVVTVPLGNSYTPLTTTAGTLYYYCVVSATGSGCGTDVSTTAMVTIIADPLITVDPVTPTAVCVGGTLPALTVTATGGTPSLNYQWYSNTTNTTTGGTDSRNKQQQLHTTDHHGRHLILLLCGKFHGLWLRNRCKHHCNGNYHS